MGRDCEGSGEASEKETRKERKKYDFGEVFGGTLVTFSRPHDLVIFVTPLVRKLCFSWSGGVLFGTFSMTFSELGPGPVFYEFWVDFGSNFGMVWGTLGALLRKSAIF